MRPISNRNRNKHTHTHKEKEEDQDQPNTGIHATEQRKRRYIIERCLELDL